MWLCRESIPLGNWHKLQLLHCLVLLEAVNRGQGEWVMFKRVLGVMLPRNIRCLVNLFRGWFVCKLPFFQHKDLNYD